MDFQGGVFFFLERAVLVISSLLTCPPTSIQKKGRRRTLRKPRSELNMCPLSCAVGSGVGHCGQAWGMRDRLGIVESAIK